MPGRSSRSKANADLLMTFGNPLRPVHDSCFPILYAWTFRHGPPDKEGPLAQELGVMVWINGYRSGTMSVVICCTKDQQTPGFREYLCH